MLRIAFEQPDQGTRDSGESRRADAARADSAAAQCCARISASLFSIQNGRISGGDDDMIRRLATFGRLIGNTDMHFGNLSFYFSLGAPLSLAPVYDMLPMLYAPVAGDQLPEQTFDPPLPGADTLHIWADMADLATQYWHDVASHELVSAEFSDRAKSNAGRVAESKKLAA